MFIIHQLNPDSNFPLNGAHDLTIRRLNKHGTLIPFGTIPSTIEAVEVPAQLGDSKTMNFVLLQFTCNCFRLKRENLSSINQDPSIYVPCVLVWYVIRFYIIYTLASLVIH